MEIDQSKAEQWKITLVDTGLKTMTGGRIKRVQEYQPSSLLNKMILNEYTAKTVITKLGLDNPNHQYTVKKILAQIKVEYPRNYNLFLLKIQVISKDRAAQIADAWASAFIERNEEALSKETSNTYDFVIGQLEKAKVSPKTAEEELERFQ